MVNTEFGQNPSVSLKNSANSLVSKSCSADRGLTKVVKKRFYFLPLTIITN